MSHICRRQSYIRMDWFSKAGDSVKEVGSDLFGSAGDVLDTATLAFNTDAELLDSDIKSRMNAVSVKKAVAVLTKIREAEDITGCAVYSTNDIKVIARALVNASPF